MKKICVLDIETTGLDPYQHEIIEIGAVIDNITFNVKVEPLHIETADQVSLEINGYTNAEWMDSLPVADAFKLLHSFAKGTVMASYNVSFDWVFMQRVYSQIRLPIPFDYHRLDIMTMAWSKFGEILSLEKVCNKLDIEPEPKVHRALNGAMKAYNVYKKLI